MFIGAALAVAALVYVLFPLFDAIGPAAARSNRPALAPESAVDALREIEFDRETGKLSDDDYSALKTEYTRKGLVEMRALRRPMVELAARSDGRADAATPNDGATGAIDPAEAAVLRYRSVRRECDACGPRPEPDPAFCSSCGKYLKGSCAHCGATVDAPASRFCGKCGSSLAA